MVTINPYLNFPGTAEEAFNFYRSIFGGEFVSFMRFSDTPEGSNVSEGDKHKLMHISLPIGKGNILMATDSIEGMGMVQIKGNNFQLAVGTESEDEADTIFIGLAKGGMVTVPLTKAFWGAYFGMLIDKFGISWMVSYDGAGHE